MEESFSGHMTRSVLPVLLKSCRGGRSAVVGADEGWERG